MSPRKAGSRDGWTRVRFGDVVRLSTERCTDPVAAGIARYVGLEHLEPGDLRIRAWGNVADGVTFTNRFRPGQVLFGKRRAYQRKVAVAQFDGICSGDIYVFEPADDRLLPQLLPLICQTEGFFEHALRTSAGSLSPRTNWQSLSSYEFSLPPLTTQWQIAAFFTAASSVKSNLRTLSTACASLKSALAESVIARYSNDIRPLGCALRLNIRRQVLSDSQIYHWAGVLSFGRGVLDRGRVKGATSKYQYVHSLRTGDVVFSKLKAWEGAVAVVPDGFENAVVSPEFPTFTIEGDVALPEYLSLIFTAPWFWLRVRNASKGTVERRTRIYPKQLMDLMVPLPNLMEQQMIVNTLVAISTAADTAGRRTRATELMISSLATPDDPGSVSNL